MLVRRSTRPGFTLVELLVVLGIIAVLLSLTIPAILHAREAAAQTQCAQNLKQLTLACHAFDEVHKRMPPTFGFFPTVDIHGGASGLGTLFFHLLPWIEEQALYESSRYKPPSTPQENYYFYKANDVHQRSLELFNCPSDSTFPPRGINPATHYATSNYAANHLVFGVVKEDGEHVHSRGEARLATSFSDGTSQTVLFGEKYAVSSMPADSAAWAPPTDPYAGGSGWAYFQADCNAALFAYYYPGSTDPNSVGPTHPDDPRDSRFQVRPPRDRCNPCLLSTPHASMNAAFADGSVHALDPGMNRFTWWALVTPSAGDHADW